MQKKVFFNYRDWYLDISESTYTKSEIFSKMDIYNKTHSTDGGRVIDMKSFLCKSVYSDEDFVLINDNLPNILYFFSLVMEDQDLVYVVSNINQDFLNAIHNRYWRSNRFDRVFSNVVDNLLIDRNEVLVLKYIEAGFVFMFKDILERNLKYKEAIQAYLCKDEKIDVSQALAIVSAAQKSQAFLHALSNEVLNFFLVNLNPFDNLHEWIEHKFKLNTLLTQVELTPDTQLINKCLQWGITDILRFVDGNFIEDWFSFCVCGNEFEDKPFSNEFKSFGCAIDFMAFRGRIKEKIIFELLVEGWKYDSFKEGIQKFDNKNMNYLYEVFNCLWELDVDFIEKVMVGLKGIPMMKDSFEEKFKNLTFRYSEDGTEVEFLPLGGKIRF